MCIKVLIYKCVGISLYDGKYVMVYSCVLCCLCDIGYISFRVYLDWLEQYDGVEWQEFINVLIINFIVFFCEQYYFIILDELMCVWCMYDWCIWCLVVFIGEEFYFIVMMVIEVLGLSGLFHLVNSDIDIKVLVIVV